MNPAPRPLAQRAFIALALFLGFYVLAAAVLAALLAAPVVEYLVRQRLDPRLALVCFVAAGFVAYAVFPRSPRFREPGPKFRPENCPALFALIDDVARAAQQSPPRAVFLTTGVEAWVSERGGVLGFGGERVLAIGVPVFAGLHVDELRAVIAHELGHFSGGDTRISGFIFRTHHAIARTLDRLERAGPVRRPLQLPFRAYGRMFLRFSTAVSRDQERHADALAANLAGAEVLAGALKKMEVLEQPYRFFVEKELPPILAGGRRPPLVGGMQALLAAPRVAPQFRQALAQVVEASRTARGEQVEARRLDSHPALHERIEALSGLRGTAPALSPVPVNASAADLVQDWDSIERHLIWSRGPGPLPAPVRWEDSGEVVLRGGLREGFASYAPAFEGLTIAAIAAILPALARRIGGIAERRRGFEPDSEDLAAIERQGLDVISGALLLTLADAGWTVVNPLGEGVFVRGPQGSLHPAVELPLLLDGTRTAEDWEERCRALGIADTPILALPEE